MFGGLDLIVVMLLLGGIGGGAARGFLGTLIDLVGIFFGLTAGAVVYLAPKKLFDRFGISGSVVDLICYLLSVIILSIGLIVLFEAIRKKVEIKPVIERIFGGILGIANGLILAGGLLIVMSGSPNAGKEIDQSKFAPRVRDVVLKTYERIERKGFTLPKMVILPRYYKDEFGRDVQVSKFMRINFTKLEGSTCINCGGKVKFVGYFPKYGTAVVPKFVCEKCGRTSDGCQTYEGYHLLYDACPIELARKGQKFDCGTWPNHTWVTPRGPCPVDGNTLDMLMWREPIPY